LCCARDRRLCHSTNYECPRLFQSFRPYFAVSAVDTHAYVSVMVLQSAFRLAGMFFDGLRLSEARLIQPLDTSRTAPDENFRSVATVLENTWNRLAVRRKVKIHRNTALRKGTRTYMPICHQVSNLFVWSLPNGTSALFGLIVPRIVEIKYIK